MSNPGETITIGSETLTVEIARCGGELQRIVDREGDDLLWGGDPAWWTGRAPLLFPVVGVLRNDEYRLGGRVFHLAKHGFARTKTFDITGCAPDSTSLRLTADDETRAHYPFEFALDIGYTVEASRLRITVSAGNAGDEPMPMSFGFHPALRWPLPYGGARDEHVLRFDRAESSPTFRWDADGLVSPLAHPNPIESRTLRPTDAMFANDALFFPGIASRSIWYGVPGRPGVRLDFDLPEFGLWTKPGAPFLCIEPWQGHNDPEGFDRDFRDKPGIVEVAPGETWRTVLDLTFGVEMPG